MHLVFFIVLGGGLLFLGVAAARVIAALRPPYKRMDKTASEPILLDGWKPLRK